jgi:CO/xanthine dehydrogenase FAD-binding subunit
MKPAPFGYFRPNSLDEALNLLRTHGDEAKVLAGGQSLVPLMNFRLAQPHYLIDLNGINGMRETKVNDRTVTLGAMVRQREVEQSHSISERLPIVSEAAGLVAHPAIRNRGTVGGSLVHADPAAELPVVAIALDAAFQLRCLGAKRSVLASNFYQGYLATAIGSDELLVDIEFPLPPKDVGWCFTEITRRHGDFAIVAVAVLLGLDSGRTVNFARIALGGIGPIPVRVAPAENAMLGKKPSAELYREASAAVTEVVDPPTDIHASSSYRRHVAGVLVRRALNVAESRIKALPAVARREREA